jgi:hypothetical protein
MRLVALLVAVMLAMPTAGFPMQSMLDARSLEEAIAIGQTRIDADRARFHRPYRIPVGTAPVDMVHVVTPFRRVEIASEERARAASNGLPQREALQVLANAPDQLDLYIELTFHPLNTYIGVPTYEVVLVPRGTTGRVEPRTVERFPRYGARLENALLPVIGSTPTVGRGAQPLLGGTILLTFDIRRLDANGAYDVVLSEAGKEMARARVDLSMVR